MSNAIHPSQSSKVLVVDDDRLVLAVLVSGLRGAGLDVIEADNGDDAILMARQQRPNLAILDMQMHGKSGLDVARYLAAHTEVPFMFLTAYGDPDLVGEATRYGAMGYLVKPLDVRQIVPTVHAALARSREMLALKRASNGAGASSDAHGGTTGNASNANTGAGFQGIPQHDAFAKDALGLNIAVGILMERFGYTRDLAEREIARQAASEKTSVAELSRSLIDALDRVNRMNRSPPA
jgi:two-component system, response regulator PdtaR